MIRGFMIMFQVGDEGAYRTDNEKSSLMNKTQLNRGGVRSRVKNVF